jgi:hypothetical protein
MKKFLNQVLVFLSVLTAVVVLSAILYGHYKEKYLANANLKFGADVKTLILGDSHAETSFDDNIIPNSRNIAFHAEHYLFTYFKLKRIIEANPKIENVILSYGPHNLSQGADVTLFSLGRNSRSFARYFMLLDKEGVDDTYSPTQNWRINYLKWKLNIPFQLKLEGKLLYKTILNKPVGINDFPFIGKFYASNNHVFIDVNEPINGHYYNKGKLLKESELAVKYLFKIIDYCKENNIKLMLVNTPLHQQYRELIPDYFNNVYQKTSSKIETDYQFVKLVDYSKLPISDSAFGDYHHVNSKGAAVVSNRIIDNLESAK